MDWPDLFYNKAADYAIEHGEPRLENQKFLLFNLSGLLLHYTRVNQMSDSIQLKRFLETQPAFLVYFVVFTKYSIVPILIMGYLYQFTIISQLSESYVKCIIFV